MFGLTKYLDKIGSVFFLLIVVVGCSPVYRNHGYTPTQADLGELVVGIDTHDSVEELLGTATSRGVRDDASWYYISSQVKHLTYNMPKVIARKVVAISFDDEDVVTNIERFSMKDGRVIALSRRVTKLPVKNMGILKQILGGIGNFDASQLAGGG